MATKSKNTTTKSKTGGGGGGGGNPVGRPKNTYGKDTLLNNKKSFKMDKNVVLDKYIDALLLMAIILIIACIILFFFIK